MGSKKKENKWRNIYELLDADKKGLKLTTREKRRLKEFKDKRAKLMPCPDKCKVCQRAIFEGDTYCSSKCKRKDKNIKNQEDAKEIESEIQDWFWANVIGRCDPKGAI